MGLRSWRRLPKRGWPRIRHLGERADLQTPGDGIDKASFVAALGAIGAGAVALVTMGILLFPEWVPLHALGAESDTPPVHVVALRSLMAAPNTYAPNVRMWTAVDAFQAHLSKSPQVPTSATGPTTSVQRKQPWSARSDSLITIASEVHKTAPLELETLGGLEALTPGLEALPPIASVASTDVASAVATITNAVGTTNPASAGDAAKQKADGAARQAGEPAKEAAGAAQDRVRELRDLVERLIR